VQEHVFSGHLLQKIHGEAVIKYASQIIWPAIFLIGCFSAVVFIKVVHYAKTLKVVQATFSKQALQQLINEDSRTIKTGAVILNCIYFLNVGFLCYRVNLLYQIVEFSGHSIMAFAFFTIVLMVLIIIQNLLIFLLTLIAHDAKAVKKFKFSSYTINQTFAILLFLCLVMAQFLSRFSMFFITTGVITIALNLLLKWHRGIVISFTEERIGFLQIFVYFCILEILPFLVAAKFIIENF
jgi:hypothetical protein